MASDGSINWGQLLGLTGAVGGSLLGASTQNGLNTAAQNAARNGQQLYGFGAGGSGGIGGSYTPNQGGLGGNVNLNYGNLTGVNSGLQGLAGSLVGQAQGINGLPSNVSGANQYMQSQLGNLYNYQGGNANAFSQAAGALPGASTNANNFYGAANSQLTAAGQDPSTYANGVYNNLTAQAQPWEQAQTAALQDSEFGKGQSGTSGGALQTQAFAQGLGTADLQRQITAQQMGQQQQAQAVTNASSLSGAGNALLTNAFSNFNTTGANGANTANSAFGQANTNVNTQSNLAGLPAQLQQLLLGNSGAALNQQGGIQTQANSLFNTGLSANQANGNLLIGAANQLGQNANGQNTSQNPYGNLLQSIFGSAANASSGSSGAGSLSGLGSSLASLFGSSAGPDMSGTGISSGSYNDMLGGYNGGTGNFDYSSLGFNSAGGEAATQPGLGAASSAANSSLSEANNALGSGTGGSLSSAVGPAGNAFGIASGLQQGGVSGYGSAALNAGKLAGQAGALSPSTSTGLSGAGNVLGIYNGLKQGGVLGDSSAAVNGAQLGAGLGAFGAASGAIGTAAGAVAAPLALYGAINNWKSGATGSDALNGASAGAAIGTAIMPGIGTAIGAIGGAAVGAISSLFGDGKVDPENANFNQYTQAYNKASPAQQPQVAAAVSNPYVALAGYFDLKTDQVGTNNTVQSTYGRMGEGKFTNALITQVQAGQKSGITDSTQMWNQVVQPWLSKQGSWSDGSTANSAALTSLVQNMTGQVMAGTYKTNFKATGGDSPFNNAAGTWTPG